MFRDGREETVDGYRNDALADEAIEFVRKHSDEPTPFYLSLNFTAPHRPWPRDRHPPEVWDRYEGCAFESCPDLSKHQWQINNGVYSGEDRAEMARGYCTSLTAADIAIGRVLEAIDALGQSEDTLVIFTSDNGTRLGHGIHGKGNATYPQNMYDQAVKVPFILSMPGTIDPRFSEAVGDNLPWRSFYPISVGNRMAGTTKWRFLTSTARYSSCALEIRSAHWRPVQRIF